MQCSSKKGQLVSMMSHLCWLEVIFVKVKVFVSNLFLKNSESSVIIIRNDIAFTGDDPRLETIVIDHLTILDQAAQVFSYA